MRFSAIPWFLLCMVWNLSSYLKIKIPLPCVGEQADKAPCCIFPSSGLQLALSCCSISRLTGHLLLAHSFLFWMMLCSLIPFLNAWILLVIAFATCWKADKTGFYLEFLVLNILPRHRSLISYFADVHGTELFLEECIFQVVQYRLTHAWLECSTTDNRKSHKHSKCAIDVHIIHLIS